MGAINFSLDERLLRFLCARLGLKWFVETGTFEGNSLAMAAGYFPKCISVELSADYYTKAMARFRDASNIEIHCGHSPEVLSTLSNALRQEPGLFWLDAHWCVAENTAGADSQSPLLEELQAIGKLHPKSVILIDDARLYLCAPPYPHRYQDWPGFSEIVRVLNELSSVHTLSILNDVIAFYPAESAEDFNKFSYENGVDWLGIVISQRDLLAAQTAASNSPVLRKRSYWSRLFG